MQIADLVKFRNDMIESQKDLSLENSIVEIVNLIQNISTRNETKNYQSDIDRYIVVLKDLSDKNQNFLTLINQTIEKIENDINAIVQQQTVDSKNEELLRPNNLSTNQSLEQIICSRISSYSDWRFPGLQLHCRYFRPENKKYPVPDNFANPATRINSMVANDPLYLVGTDIFHLKEIISSYAPIYQNRLRLYEIKERNLSQLPYAQFGFILCWDFLNYLPIQAIKWYLNECIKLLRPGGVLMFSYNNGDLLSSAKMYDSGRAGWSTFKIIQTMVTEIGFVTLRFENLPTDDNENTFVSWLEVQKPGNLNTVRLNQAIGTVLTK